MKFSLEGDNLLWMQKALEDAGYKRYGGNPHGYRKVCVVNEDGCGYYHAIIDYNYPIINLHYDAPRRKHSRKGKLRHDTVHKSMALEAQAKLIMGNSYSGRFELLRERLTK